MFFFWPALMGVLVSPSRWGVWLGDFFNFSIKITHFLCIFRQKKIFETITHQLKAFEKQSKALNGINEVQVL